MFRAFSFVVVVVGCATVLLTSLPAEASFLDSFTYVPPCNWGDPLGGNGSWLPAPTTSRIMVRTPSGLLLTNDWSRQGNTDTASVSGLNESGVVGVRFFVRGAGVHSFNRDWWSFALTTDTGATLIRWTGKSDELTFWGPGSTYTFPLMVNNGFPQLLVEADINFNTGRIDYYFNGTRAKTPCQWSPPLLSQPSPVVSINDPPPGTMPLDLGDDYFTPNGVSGTSLVKVELESFAFPRGGIGTPDYPDFPDQYCYFNQLVINSPDNMLPMVVVPEPATMSLLALGAAIALRRRRAAS